MTDLKGGDHVGEEGGPIYDHLRRVRVLARLADTSRLIP
jgi:hypothetical protein